MYKTNIIMLILHMHIDIPHLSHTNRTSPNLIEKEELVMINSLPIHN